VGNAAERAFDLVVVEAGSLKIQAAQLPLARLFEEYAVDVLATQPGGLPLAKPLSWGLAGRPPQGLALSPSADERLLLSGAPLEAGTFSFVLEVEDALGRRDVRELALTVVPPDLHLTVDLPEALAPGDGVIAHVQSSVDIDGATFRVRDGLLPQGLTLLADGTLAGGLPKELPEGIYVFTVAYQLGPTELSFRTVALNVNVAEARRLRGCGCGSTGSGLGLLVLVAHLLGRRRSSGKLARKSGPSGWIR
jgi:uncharacterized protein (TIGR03382 family)